jgi:hypothetical protein
VLNTQYDGRYSDFDTTYAGSVAREAETIAAEAATDGH